MTEIDAVCTLVHLFVNIASIQSVQRCISGAKLINVCGGNES